MNPCKYDIVALQGSIRLAIQRASFGQLGKPEIEDLVSEVNILLLTSRLDKYDPSKMAIDRYAAMIARHHTICLLRNRGRRWFTSIETPKSITDTATESFAGMVLRREQTERVKMVIASLPAHEQEFMAAMCEDDFDIFEWACREKVEEGVIRVRKHRLIAKIKKMLAEGSE